METSKLCNLCLSPGSINCDFCPFDDSSDDQGASFCSPEHLMLHKDAGKLTYLQMRMNYVPKILNESFEEKSIKSCLNFRR